MFCTELISLLAISVFFVGVRELSAEESSASVQWLLSNAVEVRTVDPADEDFSDLQPLKGLIGDSRIVHLGEPSHGDGTAFLAKVRLVKFLHQQMGFDVLIWESGLYDCWKMNEGFRTATSPSAAAGKGVFSLWSQCQQVMPLFDYAIKTWSGDPGSSPLEMAGFDCQPTSPESAESWRADMVMLLQKVEPSGIDEAGQEVLASFVSKAQGNGYSAGEERAAFLKVASQLQQKLPEASKSLSGSDIDFWVHVLENAKTYIAMVEARTSGKGQEGFQKMIGLREKSLEDTFLWQARSHFSGRKVITWGAFGHFLHGSKTIEPTNPGFAPMGDGVNEALGNEAYTIGFITFEGRAGRVGDRQFAVPAAPEGSLEALCHQTGKQNLFVDFRSHKEKAGWLRERRITRANGYRPSTADWTQVCDGFFFTDSMVPAEKVTD